MATIDTLIAQIPDAAMRTALLAEVAEMRKRLEWGLVFERHMPEKTLLLTGPIRPGSVVWERRAVEPRRFRVRAVEGAELVVVEEAEQTTAPDDAPTLSVTRADVLIETRFSEPVFPVLTSIDAVRNGPEDRGHHAVIRGENFHAIQALLVSHSHAFDVIYLDPPYNTGDRDWSYDNDYVDPNDTYRPSKWLAFMERRLRIARRLLSDNGVIVVTIDENEVHHLGMLLEQMFPEARRQMASIVINPIGQNRVGGLARVDEQAFFVFFGDAPAPIAYGDDLLNERPDTKRARSVRWEWLIRGGPISVRADRPGLFYPVLIDRERGLVVGAGPTLAQGNDPDLDADIDGYAAAWPIRTDGSQGYWRIGQDKLRRLIEQGFVRLGGYDDKRKTWTVLYVPDIAVKLIAEGKITIASRDENGVAILDYAEQRSFAPKTVWNRQRHNAGIYGSPVVSAFTGGRGAFTFPKSLYAVADTLAILTHDNKDALILDFFGGSGTTLHATMLLNAQDEGTRRCVLVTNNEVKAATATALNRKDHFRGDPEFEAAGVYEGATRPRLMAATSGTLADGRPVEGTYLDETPYSDGFPENVEFFRLDYEDPAAIEFGLRFRELHPLLWLMAGGIGDRADLDPDLPLGLPATSPYAVLFDPSGMRDLVVALPDRPDITHVFVAADSADGFSSARNDLPEHLTVVRLYRDYLDTLRGATR